jgi:hypothetical protein
MVARNETGKAKPHRFVGRQSRRRPYPRTEADQLPSHGGEIIFPVCESFGQTTIRSAFACH